MINTVKRNRLSVVYFIQQSLLKRGIVTGSRLFLYSDILSA